jgi:glutamyl-tRNA synthetase/glutamyl-Q tRNA(Asp) synthetase
MARLRTRYAPSPTGLLHIGHAAHMLWVWGYAARVDADVLLRIEDHDRGRCRPEYEEAIYEDLRWLGFDWANAIGRPSSFRQSDNAGVYQEALEALSSLGLVYRCDCSRKRIAEHSRLGEAGESTYDGHCRNRNVRKDRPHGLRLRLESAEERFDDLLLGPQAQDPARQCGDLLLRDRDGQWTYQFCVVVDDLRHGVNLVIRGEDLLDSTGRQMRLARRLGSQEPVRFLHHPLILDEQGRKLSKRTAAGPIRALRAAGRTAAEVLGEAAFRIGLTDQVAPVSVEDALGWRVWDGLAQP